MSMTTFNVFTDQVPHVAPHLFVAQVDALSPGLAVQAVGRDLGIPAYVAAMRLTAQFADDPRAHGQRFITADERAELTR